MARHGRVVQMKERDQVPYPEIIIGLSRVPELKGIGTSPLDAHRRRHDHG
jgi:hypothetical protein